MKTLLALYEAVRQLKQKKVREILYLKPIVDMVGIKDIGFLPGTQEEKLDPMLHPVRDNLQVFCKDGLAQYLIDKQRIKPVLLQDLRGRSLNSTFLIFDEAQNASIPALKLVLSRIGQFSKFAILGDPNQRDVDPRLAGPEPLSFADYSLRGIDGISFSHFTSKDVVRNGIIRDILERFEEAGM